MENCLNNGQRLCSFDVLNEFNVKLHMVIDVWRRAGDNNELICEECGRPVLLRAGDIRQPHFAHKSGEREQCSLNGRDSEEHVKAKRLLYQYFRRAYPNLKPETNYRHPGGRKSDILVSFPNCARLAVEFVQHGLSASDFREKRAFYQANNLPTLWFLSALAFENKPSKGTMVETLLNEGVRLAMFINVESESVKFMKAMEYLDIKTHQVKYQNHFSKYYLIDAMTLNPDGSIISPFTSDYNEAYNTFLTDCKEKELLEKQEQDFRAHTTREVWAKPPESVIRLVQVPPQSQEQVANHLEFSSIEVLIGLLDICKESELLEKYGQKPPYSSYRQMIAACDKILKYYNASGYLSPNDLGRLKIRIATLLKVLDI